METLVEETERHRHEEKFAVEIVYDGLAKPFRVEPEEQVSALLHKAISEFHIAHHPHPLRLFRQDGRDVPEHESAKRAGLKPGEVLLLRSVTIEIVYNGVAKTFKFEPEEQVSALLHKAISEFHITQNPHLLSLFRQDGSVVPENESVNRAGLKPGEVLLLRPNAVKGGAGVLRVAKNILGVTFNQLRECGRGACECAVYWTGPAREDVVDGVEHPIHERSPLGYEVDDDWLTRFWIALAKSARSVKAQVHTHPRDAFHSPTDDRWPIISQPGFLSIVIPDFAVGNTSLDNAWCGRLMEDGRWSSLNAISDAIVLHENA